MCGIVAELGTPPVSGFAPALQRVGRRGPERTQSLQTQWGRFGHAALSFVARGRNPQPLQQEQNFLTFNGEIYNWEALAETWGVDASNDTQVLLHGLRRFGLDCLPSLEGQFAFVAELGDSEDSPVVFGRDRWGIAPLCYAAGESGAALFASTPDALREGLGETVQIRTVPAGTAGTWSPATGVRLHSWWQLSPPRAETSRALCVDQVRTSAEEAVRMRIPEETEALFTTLGGVDSQFVTSVVARATKGRFGGAVTIVPDESPGDLPDAERLRDRLRSEGLDFPHLKVAMTPEAADLSLDGVLEVLGPDYFNVCCGLAEDLVARTVAARGGKAIMTAGGPDEAGWSYPQWTALHRNRLEKGFHAVGDQFSSAEGVRAGLVFGQHGLENRVPLAFLISLFASAPVSDKQEILRWEDGVPVLRDKILWRQAIASHIPPQSQRKMTLHQATGTKEVLWRLACADGDYQRDRLAFIGETVRLGWSKLTTVPIAVLKKKPHPVAEGQVYALWRWRRLCPTGFDAGFGERYRTRQHTTDIQIRAQQPLCYDWLPVF